MPSFLVVANADAGTAEGDRVASAVDTLAAAGATELVLTEHVDALDAALASVGDRTLVVAGGDGSVHAAVGSLWRSGGLAQGPIGIIPLGTGNDLATGLDLPTEPVAAARACVEGTPRSLDLIVTDRDEVVVNASHAGLGASAAGESGRFKETLGPLAYPLGALIAGVRESGWNLTVTLDEEIVHDGTALLVGVANGPSIGGGTRLVPPALPDDGRLDLIVVSAVTAAARVAFATALRDGLHLDRHDVLHLCGWRVTITGEPLAHDMDGDVTPDRARCTYEVRPAAWQLLVPPDR